MVKVAFVDCCTVARQAAPSDRSNQKSVSSAFTL